MKITSSHAGCVFEDIAASFSGDPLVVLGEGKGFGSGTLKVNGKIFALISSRGQFVAKLPKARVAELVARGWGEPFDPGHGRKMKEWLAMSGRPASWKALAIEARKFVG